MENFKATYKDIGLIGIPNDNSYSMNLSTYQNETIAGKQVKIMSRSFKIAVISSSRRVLVREFVLIKYDEHIIRILNSFREITTKFT